MAEAGKLYGVVFDLECPYFACFRHPTSTSVILTYPIPPFTTIRGMLSNALGLLRNDFSLQDQLQIGIQVLTRIEQTRELAKILKLLSKETDIRSTRSSFPSSPMYRYFLVRPAYRIYLGGELDLLNHLVQALNSPKRPLYLGQSDDMVTISRIRLMDIVKGTSRTVHSLVAGIHPGCELVKLPLRFEDEDTLIYTEVLSLPPRFPWELEREMDLYGFEQEFAWLVS